MKWSLQQQLKDRTSGENDPGVVYRVKYGDCEQAYIGERGRSACVLPIATKMVFPGECNPFQFHFAVRV